MNLWSADFAKKMLQVNIRFLPRFLSHTAVKVQLHLLIAEFSYPSMQSVLLNYGFLLLDGNMLSSTAKKNKDIALS